MFKHNKTSKSGENISNQEFNDHFRNLMGGDVQCDDEGFVRNLSDFDTD
jgi:hypothetical protein